MSIKAVIFDIGGVLELTPATGWQDEWAARLGLPPDKLEARLEPMFAAGSVGEMTLAEVEEGVGCALGLGRSALLALMHDLWAEYLGTLNSQLADYFACLRPRYRTGILSNSFVGAREREEQRYGFAKMCDELVYSHEEGLLKPDPRFYGIVCQRLGVPAERCVFLDDTPAHVDGARAAGLKAVRFLDNDRALRELGRLLDAPA